MATSTRKRGSKRAKAQKSSANGSGPTPREKTRVKHAKQMEQLVKLRSQDKTIAQMAEKVGIVPGMVSFLLKVNDLKPKDKIKGTDDEIAAQIVKYHDEEGEGFTAISARTYHLGIASGRVQSIYEEATKGGRKRGPKNQAAAGRARQAKGRRGKGRARRGRKTTA